MTIPIGGISPSITDDSEVLTVASGSVPQLANDATELVASVAPWLQADYDALNGKVLKAPERGEIDTPVSEQLIVELYSK